MASFKERFDKVEDATEGYEGLDRDQIEEDAGRWLEIAQSGARFALAASTGGIGGMIDSTTALYSAVLEVEQAQARLLRSIDENVQLLVDEPFTTGRTFIKRAHDTIDDPERSRSYLDKAQTKFYEAESLAKDPIDKAAVEMHLAITYFLLGYPEDPRNMLEAGYEKTAPKVIELAEQTGNTKVLTKSGKWALAITGLYGGAFLAYKKLKGRRRDNAAQEGLRELLPFLCCLAALHSATGAEPDELPAVELIEVGKDKFELVEMAA